MSTWIAPVLLGAWLSAATVWPNSVIRLADVGFLFQPSLLVTLAIVAIVRLRRHGWPRALSEGAWFYLVMNVSAWLPFLRTTAFWTPDYAYPEAYGRYLVLYEVGIAALIGFQAGLTLKGPSTSWWVSDGWSRPLVIAPLWLIIRGIQAGHWATCLVGVMLGLAASAAQARLWSRPSLESVRVKRLFAAAVFLVGAVLVYGSAMRIYALTGANFPAASDDGINYFHFASLMVKEPGLFFRREMGDMTFFSGYYVVMGLWFMIAGPHMPFWLLWHALAGGLLALAGYWLGARLAGPVWGVVAAVLIVADRVTLHLLATMNMETFFVPVLYLAVLVWVKAGEATGRTVRRLSEAAGALLGLATVFRPTGALLPLVFGATSLIERGRHPRRARLLQVLALAVAFSIVLWPMLVRHRIAWGEWSLGGTKAANAIYENYALVIKGQRVTQVGLMPWLGLIAEDPTVVWRTMIPGWWNQGLRLWTNQGFGQMDLVRGLHHDGQYQAALRMTMALAGALGAAVMIGRRTRLDLALLALPAYFTSLVLVFFVIGSRYRAPFIPALYLFVCVGLSAVAASHRSYEGSSR